MLLTRTARAIRTVDLRSLVEMLGREFPQITAVHIFGSRRNVTGSVRSDIDLLLAEPFNGTAQSRDPALSAAARTWGRSTARASPSLRGGSSERVDHVPGQVFTMSLNCTPSPSKPGWCCRGDQGIFYKRTVCAVALQQNPVSLSSS